MKRGFSFPSLFFGLLGPAPLLSPAPPAWATTAHPAPLPQAA